MKSTTTPTIPTQTSSPTPTTSGEQIPQAEYKNSGILKIIIAMLCFVLGAGQILTAIILSLFVVPQMKTLQESAELGTTTNFHFVYACLAVTIILGCIILFLGYRVLKLKLRLIHAVITLIVVFILQGIIGGIIISSILFPIYKMVSEVNSNQISPSPTLTQNPAENWKTYKSDNYSFQYPKTWKELTEENNDTNAFVKSKKIFTPDTCISGGCGGFHSGIHVYVEKNPNSYHAQDYFQKVIVPEQKGCGDVKEVEENQNLLGSYDAIIAEGFCGAGIPGPTAYIVKDNYVIVIASDGIEKQTAYQILSTFKFTDSQTTDTSNWKTYTNPLKTFTVKYPSDLSISEYSNDSAVRFEKHTDTECTIIMVGTYSLNEKEMKDYIEKNFVKGNAGGDIYKLVYNPYTNSIDQNIKGFWVETGSEARIKNIFIPIDNMFAQFTYTGGCGAGSTYIGASEETIVENMIPLFKFTN